MALAMQSIAAYPTREAVMFRKRQTFHPNKWQRNLFVEKPNPWLDVLGTVLFCLLIFLIVFI